MSKLLKRPSFADTYDIKLEGGYCTVNAAVGKDWLTIYIIETDKEHRGQGEATRLLTELKKRCAQNNQILRVWCPLNGAIVHLCKKLNIEMIDGIDN